MGGGCSDEAHEHDHNCGHDHDDTPERGIEYGLFKHVDLDKVTCLNEAEEGSGRTVLKPWHQRFEKDKFVESDADEQLILHIPFAGSVSIKSIKVIGGEGETHPKKVKVFGNRADIDFDNVGDILPLQEFALSPDPQGELDYPTKASKFQNLHNLTFFFENNYGDDQTKVYYVGLSGEFKPMKRDTIITVYELNANPADHKVKDEWKPHSTIS